LQSLSDGDLHVCGLPGRPLRGLAREPAGEGLRRHHPQRRARPDVRVPESSRLRAASRATARTGRGVSSVAVRRDRNAACCMHRGRPRRAERARVSEARLPVTRTLAWAALGIIVSIAVITLALLGRGRDAIERSDAARAKGELSTAIV